ncbi:MAG TPA: hypothetical protein VGM86_22805 [Thermoanaerobaculia bacterium]|jgi:hypothetical protein
MSTVRRLLIVLLLLTASGPLQAQRPLDDPFQVNVRREAFETSPHVATNRAGDFVVTWAGGTLESGNPGTEGRLYARRFGADGRPATGEIQVADQVAPFATSSAVALMGDGSFAVAFSQWRQTPSSTVLTLKVRWYTPEGAARGDAVVVRSPGDVVSMATAGDGGVVLAWSQGFDTGLPPVWARAYGPDRAPLGPAVLVAPSGVRATVAAAADGSFAVAWQDLSPARNPRDRVSRVALRRFAPDGSPRGKTLDVAGSFRFDGLDDPLLMIFAGVDGDGNVLVVWSQIFGAPGTSSPSGRWVSAAGQPLGRIFSVPPGDGNAVPDAFAVGGRGNFVLSWHRESSNGTIRDVLTRRYSRDGTPPGSALQVNEDGPTLFRFEDAAGILPGGRWVVVWGDGQPDGAPVIFARRFRSR